MVPATSAPNPSEDWQALVKASMDGIIVVDGDGIVRYANPAARRLFEDQVTDLVGFHFGVPAIHEPVPLALARAGEVTLVELRASEISWSGRRATLAMLRDVTPRKRAEDALRESLAERDRLLELADRTRLAQLSMVEDQMEAAEALRESVRFVQSTLDSLSANIALLDDEGRILLVNKSWRDFAEANGGSAASMSEGANYLQVCAAAGPPDDDEARRFADGIRRVLHGEEEEFSLEYACEGPIESRGFVGRVTPFPGPGPRRVVVSHGDITERKRSEDRVRHLNRVLRSIREVNQLAERKSEPDVLIRDACQLLIDHGSYDFAMIILTDPAGLPIAWAESGRGSAACRVHPTFRPGDLPPCCLKAMDVAGPLLTREPEGQCGKCSVSGNQPAGAALCIRLTHGETSHGFLVASMSEDRGMDEEERDLFGKLAGDLSAALDASADRAALALAEEARETIQRQLLQAQKMEAVGRLAGGVAHDYNNMLSVILGHASMGLEKVEEADPLHEDLKQILGAANRSADITRQLLAFARQQTATPRVIDVNQAVEGTVSMLRRLIGEDVTLEWIPGSDLEPIRIDPVQLDQALTNLCVNSRDAIKGVGRITVTTSAVLLDEQGALSHRGSRPGRYIGLTVSDNGTGMTPATLDHLFEPFFTTKQSGKGTGLGMSMVYGITEQNGGFIDVTSELGHGTSVGIFLPACADHVAETVAPPEAGSSAAGGETILIVEDEAAILGMARTLLGRLGYGILTASTPTEAMALARDHEGEIHLIITDVVMPDMNGRELVNVLLTLRPEARCLFMSGYTADIVAERGVLDEGMHFIEKPFEIHAFSAKVRAVLDSPQQPQAGSNDGD